MRTRQFTPGRIKLLQCLHICRLYSVGKRILAAMAIFLAMFMYRCASCGLSWKVSLAKRKSVWMRCVAMRFVVSCIGLHVTLLMEIISVLMRLVFP